MSGIGGSGLGAQPRDRRKLVAVMYADMVGYSRLIGLDDQGTLDRLRALRTDLINPAVEEHGGKIVQTGGDSLLIMFESIDGAMRCAVKVQRELPALDSDQSADRAIRFRVGINIGDAIPDGTDLHGDAVNVAVRLQTECPPGAVCVSRSVRDHVHGRLGLEFEELGPLDLKNIARRIEAFVVRLDSTAPLTSRRLLDNTMGDNPAAVGKPSVAVLAFTNMSGDPEQEYFSDGISDDIITELSRSRSLLVIARNSSFTYRGQSVDLKQVARELGVRYVVDGAVRRSGTRVRVSAQLVEVETGSHIWAERYDRNVEEIFALQDEITTAIVKAIEPVISDAELGRILRKPPGSLGAWEAYQRGLWHMAKHNAADDARAKELFARTIALDAAFGAAYYALADLTCREGTQLSTRPLHDAAETATSWARKAVEIAYDDSDAWAMLAIAVLHTGKVREALEYASKALMLNPNSAWANGAKGGILLDSGHPAEARDLLLSALRLNPRDPRNASVLNHIARSHYYERDYVPAADTLSITVTRYPDHPTAYCWLAATLGQLGRLQEATDALQRAREIAPETLQRIVQGGFPFLRAEDHQHTLDGLRKAGWRD